MESKKIKELYDCDYIVSDEELYPLQRWYNQLIDKRIDEITIADVLRMIRQKKFINLAIQKAIEFLQDDTYAGELYAGQLFEKVSETEITLLKPYVEDLKIIIKDALDKSEIHEWSYDGEEEEFKEIVDIMSKKIM